LTASHVSQAFTDGSGGSESADRNATAGNVPVSVSGSGCGSSAVLNADGGHGGSAYVFTSAKALTESVVINPPVFAATAP
jgi:hypothetical protein